MDDFAPDAWPPIPKCNPNLQGHGEAEEALLEAFNSERMHHAWLLTGPKGIGKATLAYRFVRFVLSQPPTQDGPSLFGDALPTTKPTTLQVSKENPVFQRIAADGHGDLLSIERRVNEKNGKLQSEIVIESVRQVASMMSKTSAEGGWRVVVVDAADEMNSNAANALLKVLEEPPKKALLLLISHNPGRLLPTIRSRCRTLPLRPLSERLVTELSQDYAPHLSEPDAKRLAQLSDGSIGRALGLVDVGGIELYGQLMSLLHTLPKLDIKSAHALADKVAKVGADQAFQTVTDLLRWWLERMILVAAGKVAPDGEDADFMRSLAGQASLESWFLVWEKINSLVARTNGLHLDKKQIVLNVLLDLESTVAQGR